MSTNVNQTQGGGSSTSTQNSTQNSGGTGAGGQGAGGTSTGNTQGSGAGNTNTTDGMVSRAELQRVLDELHGFKTQARQLQDEKRTQEEAQLRENQRWKELSDRYQGERDEALEKVKNLGHAVAKDKKLSVVREEALKKGIRPEALQDLEMLPLNDVQVETTSTGRINVIGAGSAIESLKAQRPHWFGTPAGPGVNTNSPGVNTPSNEKVTIQQLRDAETNARKTGDSSDYQRLHKLFKAQRGA
jgi:hypothetical protein